MGDVQALSELLTRLLQSNEEGKEAADQRQRELIAQLVAARPDVAALRADKVAKLGAALRKSTKIKDFKEDDCAIKEWLRRWEHEVESLKKMCGIPDALTRDEGVGIFKDRLDYTVIKRLDSAFAAKDPVWTWAAITWNELKDILKEEFGTKVAQVGEVLLQFGPGRLKKTSEQSVASFTHEWLEQLPECMTPNTEAEYRAFADLMKRSLFYYCLDDLYLQKELCELEGDITFKRFYDQAIIAEQRRKSFQEIGESGAKLDPGGAACLAMLDGDQMSQAGGGEVAAINYYGGGSYGSSQFGGRGRGQYHGGMARGQSNRGGGMARGHSFGQYGQSYGGQNQSIGGGMSNQSYGGQNQSIGGGMSN